MIDFTIYRRNRRQRIPLLSPTATWAQEAENLPD